MVMNNIVPTLFIKAEMVNEEEKNIMKISIPKSRAVVATLQGKILDRRLKSSGEPENTPMFPYEMTTRLSDLSLLDFSFKTINSATVEDFDKNELLRMRQHIQISRN